MTASGGNQHVHKPHHPIAATGAGVPELADAIGAVGVRVAAAGTQARRRRRARYLIARAAADLVADRIRAGQVGALDELADAVLAGALLPAQAAGKLIGSEFESK